MAKRRLTPAIRVGDLYEDCAYHPCVCVAVENGELTGISLIDGSYPRSCDLGMCGIRKLSPDEAMDIRLYGPPDASDRRSIRKERRWWTSSRPRRKAV